jgi:hypothetical protein
MNPLTLYIASKGLDEITTMNRLTEAGIVSDNAVTSQDVATKDAEKAVAYLKLNPWK